MTKTQTETWTGAAAPWLLGAYLLVPPLFKGALQPFVPVDLTVLLAIPTAAVGGGWLVLNRYRLERRQVVALVLWFALAALVMLGVLWAPDRVLALRSTAYFGLLATLPVLAAFPVAADLSRVRTFLLVFVIAGAIMVIIATVALFTGSLGGQYLIGANRLSVARGVLFVPLIGVPLLAWHRFGPPEWLLAALASLAMFVAVATASRAASIGFVLLSTALVVGTLIRSKHKGRVLGRAGILVAGTLVAFVALSGLLPEGSPARFGLLVDVIAQVFDGGEPGIGGQSGSGDVGELLGPDELEEPVGGSSVAQRGTLYRLAWFTFLDYPLLGAGTSGFQVVAGYEYPHNLVLHVASEFGLVGLAVLGAMGGLAVLGWRPDSNVSVALGVLLAFLLLNAMFSNGIYENRVLWGVWLVLLARPTAVSPDALPRPAPAAR